MLQQGKCSLPQCTPCSEQLVLLKTSTLVQWESICICSLTSEVTAASPPTPEAAAFQGRHVEIPSCCPTYTSYTLPDLVLLAWLSPPLPSASFHHGLGYTGKLGWHTSWIELLLNHSWTEEKIWINDKIKSINPWMQPFYESG